MIDFVRRNWTVRVRLTVLYGGLFFLAGTVLLGVTYLLFQQALRAQPINEKIVSTAGDPAFANNQTTAGQAVQSGGVTPPKADARSLTPEEVAAAKAKFDFAQQLQEDFQRQTLTTLVTRGSIALGAVGVGAVWLGWLVSGRTLRPIQQITATARRVADRSLHERIALAGPRDELRELADTFDSMLERLDRSFDGQRRFVGNASHELRTPLAINRTLLEVALSRPDVSADLRQIGGTLLEVNARHERLIDGLLTLARSDNEVTNRQEMDLADVAAHVVDQARGEALRGGVEIVTSLDPAPTAGDPVLLERLALNLVQNAVRYNAPDGWVNVTTHNGGDTVALVVTNTGPVVSPYEIPGLFEPFRRLADRVGSARGTGLGLSIVRSVARAHGGEVVASPHSGGGLVMRVSLPAAAGAAN
jgi:signal transduction histidine kinase